jgi:hypothetical protein
MMHHRREKARKRNPEAISGGIFVFVWTGFFLKKEKKFKGHNLGND